MTDENKDSKKTAGGEDKRAGGASPPPAGSPPGPLARKESIGFFKRLKTGLFHKKSSPPGAPAASAASFKTPEKPSPEAKTPDEKTKPSSVAEDRVKAGAASSSPSPSAGRASEGSSPDGPPASLKPSAASAGILGASADKSAEAAASPSLKEKSDAKPAEKAAKQTAASAEAGGGGDASLSAAPSADKEGAAEEGGRRSETAATSAEKPQTTAKPPADSQATKPPRPSLPPARELPGLFAFKMESVSLYDEKGKRIAATALHYEPWRVSQIKTKEKDGYSAVQLACRPQKNGRCGKALAGHLSPAGFKEGALQVREIRLNKDAPEDIQPGCELSLESLSKGDKVRISGLSKGRGFSGVMKRWGFRGGKASHGAKTHRKTGAVGQHTEPSRVFPGRKMPGRFGYKKVSIRNVQVVDVLPEERLIFVKGAVPGARRSLIALTKQPDLKKRARF